MEAISGRDSSLSGRLADNVASLETCMSTDSQFGVHSSHL